MENENVLICVIVNKGYTDLVMEAAKNTGATGGTIFNGRGTGNINLEKFYGIEVKPEKEIVFIVTKQEIKEKMLKEIYKDAGLETRGQGIAFSLPVDDLIIGKSSKK